MPCMRIAAENLLGTFPVWDDAINQATLEGRNADNVPVTAMAVQGSATANILVEGQPPRVNVDIADEVTGLTAAAGEQGCRATGSIRDIGGSIFLPLRFLVQTFDIGFS